MLEILITTLILFSPFFILFIIIPSFKYIKITMIIIQIIFSFVLVSNILYKKHSLYSNENVKYIQSLDFFPIKSLYEIDNEDGAFQNISYDLMDDNQFSIIQTKKYSTQCLDHYFIKKDETCPITDIIFDNKLTNVYNDYIRKSNNEYFYYTNQNKLGKLFKSFNYSDFEEKKEVSFTNDEINKIVRKEFNKISNPLIDFKYFIKFFDVICVILLFNSLSFSFFESLDDTKCGVIRVFNLFLQIIILFIYVIRFSEFMKVKLFLFDNEDIYKDDSYFPNKLINFDSVPLALSINVFLINALYMIFPNHELCVKNKKNFCDFDGFRMIVIIFLISKFIIEIFDIINDSKIFPIYDNIIYNWNINPIKNIYLNNNSSKVLESYLLWKGNNLKLERLNEFNYINIYSSSYSKLCGKDNLGNNLYFPENIDCPINDIFFSKSNDNIPGYTKIKLNNDNYLYYTNQSNSGKIIIDLRISNMPEIPLNPEGDSESNYYSIPFYEDFDSDNFKKLYSINYLGINSSSISKDKLDKFEKKVKVYHKIYITKIVFFCALYINIIIIIIFSCIFKKENDNNDILVSVLSIIFTLFLLVHFALIIACLDFQRRYINNIINKINFDIEKRKIDIKWNIMVLIYFLFIILFTTVSASCEEKPESHKGKDNQVVQKVNQDENNKNIIIKYDEINVKEKDKDKIELKIDNNKIKSDRINLNSEEMILKINKNISISEKPLIKEKDILEKKINNLTKEKDILDKKVNDITNEKDILEKKVNQLTNNNNSLLKENTILEKKINELTNNNNSLLKQKDILEKKINDLTNEKNLFIKEKDKYKKNFEELLKNKNKYKFIYNNPDEVVMTINFVSMGNSDIGHYSLPCKKTDLFLEEEEKLLEDFSKYKNHEIIFEANGKRIERYKTLEENNIKNNDIINMFIMEE